MTSPRISPAFFVYRNMLFLCYLDGNVVSDSECPTLVGTAYFTAIKTV